MITAWHPAIAGPGTMSGMAGLHLAFLMMTGTAAALLTLVGHGRAQEVQDATVPASTGAAELMAQMSHELRTPLNAVIGFSQVMLRELHGPLGNARYQEYAHHISESGNRLLKTSEDALAVTEAMMALMANRTHPRRERALAGPLVREAWRQAAAGATNVRLATTACKACDITCERGATAAALEHLLREAITRAPAGGTIEVSGQRQAGRRSLSVRVAGASELDGRGPDSLCLILARLLLATQGATLKCATDESGAWRALIEFPPKG
jgi:signal transduction histidine kinase